MGQKNNININSDLKAAIENRDVSGFRYNNSKYWHDYYQYKLINHDIEREIRYAHFLKGRIKTKAKVLDVATGYGFLPVELKKAGFEVTAVDSYSEMINLAKLYFKENKIDIKLYQADVIDMPFNKESFDIVTAISILEHFPISEIKDKFFPEISRVLKTNGCLMVHMPVKSIITVIKKRLKLWSGDLPNWACDEEGDVTHKIWLSTSQYLKLIKESDFEIKYVAFNFIRSNESSPLSIILNRILCKFFNSFYKIENKLTLKLWFISLLATSVAFISIKKNSIIQP